MGDSFNKSIKTGDRLISGEVRDERMDWDGGDNIVYHGVASVEDADTAAAIWHIAFITYDSNKPVRIQTKQDVAWDDRATLWA